MSSFAVQPSNEVDSGFLGTALKAAPIFSTLLKALIEVLRDRSPRAKSKRKDGHPLL
jgi:hypothetical protein